MQKEEINMNMGHAISEIVELYHKGKSIDEICKITKSDNDFVKEVIKDEQINQAYEQYRGSA